MQIILQTRFVLFTEVVLQLLRSSNWFKRFRASNFDLKDEDRSGHSIAMDINLIKAMLTENLQICMHQIMPLTFPRQQYIIRYIIWSGWDMSIDIKFAFHSIDGDRLYKLRLYVRFLFPAKEIFFLNKSLETRLGFCIKICIENAFDLRIIESRSLNFIRKKFVHFMELERYSLLWALSSRFMNSANHEFCKSWILQIMNSVNHEYCNYCNQLNKLKDTVAEKWLKLMNWQDHHDNAKPYVALAVREKLLQFN